MSAPQSLHSDSFPPKAKIAVLVACYNAVHFLPHCLYSLRNQSLQDIQIICIDDASTDGTWTYLQQVAAEDNRVVPIHLEENSGQAHARNVGLKFVDADFVTMVDADDALSPYALTSAYDTFMRDPETDAVAFRLIFIYPNGERKPYHFLPVAHREGANEWEGYFTGEEAFVESLDQSLHGLYVVRTSIHRAFPYDESCRLYSDDNTAHIHYLRARRVRYCSGEYLYLQHSGSMTHSVDLRRFDFMDAGYSLKRQVLAEHPSPIAYNRMERFRWLAFLSCVRLYQSHRRTFSSKERKEIRVRLFACWQSMEWKRLKHSSFGRWVDRPFGSFTLFIYIQRLYVLASSVYWELCKK